MVVSIVVATGLISIALCQKSDPTGQGIADYGQYVGKYAGKYQKYMPSVVQDQAKGGASKHNPDYAQTVMPDTFKSDDAAAIAAAAAVFPYGEYDRKYVQKGGQGANYSKYATKHMRRVGGHGDFSKYQEKYEPHIKNMSDGGAIRRYYMSEYGPDVKNSSNVKEVRDYYKTNYAEKYADKYTSGYSMDFKGNEAKEATQQRATAKAAAEKPAEAKKTAKKRAEEEEASTTKPLLLPAPAPTLMLNAQVKHTCADGSTFHCAGGKQHCIDNSPSFCAQALKAAAQTRTVGTVSHLMEGVEDLGLSTTMLVTIAGGVMLAGGVILTVIAMQVRRPSQQQPFIDLKGSQARIKPAAGSGYDLYQPLV